MLRTFDGKDLEVHLHESVVERRMKTAVGLLTKESFELSELKGNAKEMELFYQRTFFDGNRLFDEEHCVIS